MNLAEILASLKCGNLSFQPYIVLKNGRQNPRSVKEIPGNGTLQLSAEYDNGIQDDLFFRETPDGIICRRLFSCGEKALELCELGAELKGITFGKDAAKDFFYHNENPRIYEKMTFPVDYSRTSGDAKDSNFDAQAGNRWADPGVVCDRIGRSPYQPFPAILLSNYETKQGLVHGTLSQKVFYHNYLVSHENGTVTMQIFSSFKDIGALHCPAGKFLSDEWYLGATEHADDLELLFRNYTAELRKHLPPMYGATKINRDNMVWGSWNDGIFRKISEEMILKEARFLKENFPAVRWIQVDDGYAVNVPPAHGLGVPYEGEAGVDHKKFPRGLRAFTESIREIGLRPAVWIGGFCPKFTPIYQDHPEWFINYDYRVDRSSPLDVSQQVVREYIQKALDTFFLKYGFEGMKHDFWSYAFEDSHDLLKEKEQSGYQLRDWWLKEIRKRIPADAYLQTGCDIVMGNPFLGEYFTNYRYGIDIGSGKWDYVKVNFLWGIACFATHTSDLFVPNSDSVGLFPGLNDTEALFCLNYCLTTHTMVEIAGKLSEADTNSPRFYQLKKAVCNPNNGQEIFLADYDYRDPKRQLPPVIYFHTGHFTPAQDKGLPVRSAGLFNVDDAPKTIRLSPEMLKLKKGNYLLKDVWNNETIPFNGELSFQVPAHGSRLFAVSEAEGRQILDADMRINSFNGTDAVFDYAGKAELFTNFVPAKLLFNGKELAFEKTDAEGSFKLTFQIPEKGTVSFC